MASVLNVSVGYASDTGAVRERNEDSALSTPRLFAVADGMGGHAGGDVASRLAVESLMRLADKSDLQSHDVVAAIAQANRELLEAMTANRQLAGMGTTLTGLGITGSGLEAGSDPGSSVESREQARWVIFNVGDSRVYRFADGVLERLTVDHSEVEELVAAGRLTPEEAKVYPRRNVVTRSLGTIPAPAPDVWLRDPIPGERFLICSDGLPLEVSEGEIASVLRDESEPQRAADRLVELALTAGGRDNVTVIVVAHDF
jgi:protein phosphatase